MPSWLAHFCETRGLLSGGQVRLVPRLFAARSDNCLKRRLFSQPCLIGALFLHDDSATHGVVPDAAQFGAQASYVPVWVGVNQK